VSRGTDLATHSAVVRVRLCLGALAPAQHGALGTLAGPFLADLPEGALAIDAARAAGAHETDFAGRTIRRRQAGPGIRLSSVRLSSVRLPSVRLPSVGTTRIDVGLTCVDRMHPCVDLASVDLASVGLASVGLSRVALAPVGWAAIDLAGVRDASIEGTRIFEAGIGLARVEGAGVGGNGPVSVREIGGRLPPAAVHHAQ
jgi:hypothetical protein